MRPLSFFFLLTLLANLPMAAFAQPASTQESFTSQNQGDLLKRTRAQNHDVGSLSEHVRQTPFTDSAATTPDDYLSFLTAAFNNFERLMFAPLKVTEDTPTAEVRNVCRTINTHIDQLVADAETRQSMPLPTSLQEAKRLDELIQRRFQDFQVRFNTVGKQMQASGRIMGAQCTDLAKHPGIMKEAMQVTFAGFGPVGWCRAMMKQPRAEWTMEEDATFAQLCQGVQLD